MAVAAVLWTGGFMASAQLPGLWWQLTALALAWGIAALLARRAPLPAAALVGAAHVVALYWGLPLENPAPLAPALLVVYSCGRFIPDAAGLLAVPLLLAPMAAPGTEASPGDALFGAVLYCTGFAFGRLVRRRFAASVRASATASRLAARDPVHVARLQMDVERARVAEAALTVIGESIEAMSRAAARAWSTLHPEDISTINRTGAQAVVRLKALLIDLRSGHVPNDPHIPPPALPPPPSGKDRRPRVLNNQPSGHRVRWLIPTGIIGVLLVAETSWPFHAGDLPVLAALVAVAAALLLRRRSPAATCLAVAAILLTCTLTGAPLPEGLALSTGVAVATWCAVVRGQLPSLIAAATLALILCGLVAAQTPANAALNVGLLGFTAFAAHAWRAHGRAEQAALSDMEEQQIKYADSFDAALAAGRLELARTIHDTASHAVGAMVMQANAAAALVVADQSAARGALELVSKIGAEAAAGLESLGTGTGGRLGSSAAESLQDLIDHVKAAGNPVVVDQLDAVAPHLASVAYRAIRESLYNAARHAPGSTIHLRISAANNRCTLSIVNGPSSADAIRDAPHQPGPGFGLQGLRELVAGLGGTLTAGPVATAGPAVAAGPPGQVTNPASCFQVLAVLPTAPARILPTVPSRRQP